MKHKKRTTPWEANKEALEKIFPGMLVWLDAQEKQCGWATPISCKNGEPNFLVSTRASRVAAYDVDDPQNEPKAFVRSMIKSGGMRRDGATVVIGLGIGYLAETLLQQSEKRHTVIVAEPIAEMIRMTLERVDLSRYITNRRLLICPTAEDVSYSLGQICSERYVQSWNMIGEPYTLYRVEYEAIRKHASDVLNQVRCSVGTVMSAGNKISTNDIESMPYLIGHPGVKELFGLFKGLPAVTVSTGPSLDRNIHLLKDCQDRVVIVAVGQALRPLLAHGIRPDFFCSVDFGAPNWVHFDGLMDLDIPMVILNRAYPDICKRYRGPKFVCSSWTSDTPENSIHGIMMRKGVLEAGGSVAHMALQLAVVMGCGPIMLIGQDLAYPGERSHTRLADVAGRVEVNEKSGLINWTVDDPRSDLREEKFPTGHGMGAIVSVPGWFGKPVVTNQGLLSFLHTFEGMIKPLDDNGMTVLNCTEGGALILGAEPMPLDEALRKFCTTDIEDKMERVERVSVQPEDLYVQVSEAITAIEGDLPGLRRVKDSAEKGLEALPKILGSINRPKVQARHLADNEKWSKDAQEAAKKIPLVGMAIYGATMRIMSHEVCLPGKANDLKNKARLKSRCNRNRIILEAARDASIQLEKAYTESLRLLRSLLEADDRKNWYQLDPEPVPSLSDAEALLAIGNWAKPLLEIRRMPEERHTPEVDQLMDRVTKIRMEQIAEADAIRKRDKEDGRYAGALSNYLLVKARRAGAGKREPAEFAKIVPWLRRAHEADPKNSSVLWALATTLHHSKLFEESLVEYDKLIEMSPDEDQFRFERGQVLLTIGNMQAGLNEVKLVMGKSDRFDAFLPLYGDILSGNGMDDEATLAYETYLLKVPLDIKVMRRLRKVLLRRDSAEVEARVKELDDLMKPLTIGIKEVEDEESDDGTFGRSNQEAAVVDKGRDKAAE